MKKLINMTMKGIAVLLIACAVIGTVGYIQPAEEVQAAAKKVTRMAFIKGVVDAMTGQSGPTGYELTFKKNSDGSIEAGEMKKKTYSKSDIAKLAKKYKTTTENAQYIACAITYGVITKSTFKSVKSKITRAAAGIMLAKADRVLRASDRQYTDEEIKLGMSRISDIKKIKKSAQQKLFAEAYMDGFFIGKSTGEYEDTRKLSPTAKIKTTEAKKMYQMLTDTSKRYQLSPYYQVLRQSKKNLPKNAECYAYILDSYPNAYYETGWHAMEYGNSRWSKMKEDGVTPDGLGAGTLEQRLNRKFGTLFVYPSEMDEYLGLDEVTAKVIKQVRTWENIELTRQCAVEFYELAMNVNYKTIKDDKKWQEKMLKYMTQAQIDKYIEDCIRNKTIIECDKVAADISSAYWAVAHPYVKVYAHVKVVSDANISDRSHWDDRTYGNLYPVVKGYGSCMDDDITRAEFYAARYKKGEWFDYFTVAEGCDPDIDVNFSCNLAGTHCTVPITTDLTGDYPWLLDKTYWE